MIYIVCEVDYHAVGVQWALLLHMTFSWGIKLFYLSIAIPDKVKIICYTDAII